MYFHTILMEQTLFIQLKLYDKYFAIWKLLKTYSGQPAAKCAVNA